MSKRSKEFPVYTGEKRDKVPNLKEPSEFKYVLLPDDKLYHQITIKVFCKKCNIDHTIPKWEVFNINGPFSFYDKPREKMILVQDESIQRQSYDLQKQHKSWLDSRSNFKNEIDESSSRASTSIRVPASYKISPKRGSKIKPQRLMSGESFTSSESSSDDSYVEEPLNLMVSQIHQFDPSNRILTYNMSIINTSIQTARKIKVFDVLPQVGETWTVQGTDQFKLLDNILTAEFEEMNPGQTEIIRVFTNIPKHVSGTLENIMRVTGENLNTIIKESKIDV